MADNEVSFTDMGKALDEAAALYRDDTSSVDTSSTPSEPAEPSVDTGSTPQSGDNDATSAGNVVPPKTENTPNGTGDANGVSSNGDTTPATSQDSERRQFNHQQAALRIARKRAREREYLEKRQRMLDERDSFADEGGSNHNPTMAAVKEDQIRELDIAEAQRRQAEFVEESRAIFQDETVVQSFVQDCKTYGDWINNNEPELSAYIKKPYGKLVLKGWFDKIAKVPKSADWWESLTPFEKNQTLDRYYKEFAAYIDKLRNGGVQAENGNTGAQAQTFVQQTPPPAKPSVSNVPVPGSGRNSEDNTPTGNFALELDKAMRLNGVTKLVR